MQVSNKKEIDWKQVASLLLVSRAMDDVEELELMPAKKVLYQFSARGHGLSQVLMGTQLTHPKDGVGAYYRSRPLLLSVGLNFEDALAGPLARSGGYSDGRDIGVVCNLPNNAGPTVLPMAGDVGSQYTPAVGWAQALTYRRRVLNDTSYNTAIALVHGGDASVATNGFWSALTIATTQRLPVLFFIEDNGYGISVPSELQTPGANIAANLADFHNLTVLDGNGCVPDQAAQLVRKAVQHVRSSMGPVLLRLTVPRLCGHSGQDTQAYRTTEELTEAAQTDPLPGLQHYLETQGLVTQEEWAELERQAESGVRKALDAALARPEPEPSTVTRFVFSEATPTGANLQMCGGLLPEGHRFPEGTFEPSGEPNRINFVTAIRRTLEHELETNPKLIIFGEDVGKKGGVHAATLGLQAQFGGDRVFDTSLSEEGIIGRAVGMALCGMLPVPEIQFRKYADPATEQLNNCGTIRWRTANRFAAPMVVRMPGGFAKCGDPWHSKSDFSAWAHAVGWRIAVPSNAEDAVGLLRTALRGNDPTIFFEHRAMLDAAWARRPYPGDGFTLPFGKAKLLCSGDRCSLVSWGGMVQRCESASKRFPGEVELIDLRTLSPWDKDTVLTSVRKTRRCLIVDEDTQTCGFSAEVAAVVAAEAFFDLDAPPERLCMPDIPMPYNIGLMEAVLPDVETIAARLKNLMEI